MISYLENGTLPTDDEQACRILLDSENYYLDLEGLLHQWWYPSGRRTKELRSQLEIPATFRHEILVACHDSPLSGHMGINKTYEKVRERYFWKGMFKDCEHWVQSCVDCSMKKTPKNKQKAIVLPIPVGAWERVGVDCLGPFPVTDSGNRHIVVFTEYLTKWCEAFPVATIDAPTIARLLVDEIVCRHGAPRTLLSDRGKNFMSNLIKEVCQILNIKKIQTSSYHPCTNGLTEKMNEYLAHALSMYSNSKQTNWDLFIPSILFGYRTSIHPSTGNSPYYLL